MQLTTVATLQRRTPWWKTLSHWGITFLGNLAGSLFVTAVLFAYGGVFKDPAYKAEAIAFAEKKQVAPEWYMIFLRGIGCNWLVCLSIYMAIQGQSLASKLVGMWFPVFAFVSLGFDHTVANMTFIPLGIMLGAPGITVGLYIWKGIIPVVLGNIVGGGLFCGKCALFLGVCLSLSLDFWPARSRFPC